MNFSHEPSEWARTLAVPTRPRYASLDAWRGLACLMIVALHSSFYVRVESLPESTRLENPMGVWLWMLAISRSGIGVHLFFVISGYCIAATADSTRRKPTGVSQYFIRRLRRIFPPYWTALLLTASAVTMAWVCGLPDLLTDVESPIPHPASLTCQQWVGNLTLTETWRQYVSKDPYALQLGPSWSLCYEEQFYMVCGLILLISPRRFFRGAAVVTVVTLGVAMVSFLRPLPPIRGFFFDGRWLIFATGMSVYYVLNYTAGTLRRTLFGLFGLTVVLTALLRYGLLAKNQSWEVKDQAFEYFVASAFGLLLLVLHRWDNKIAGSRLLRPLMFCGTMCYSLYLIHWPITKLISHWFFQRGVTSVWGTLAVTIPVGVMASVGAAWAFHRLVEKRFLNSSSPTVRSDCFVPDPGKSAGLVWRPVLAQDSADGTGATSTSITGSGWATSASAL